MLILLNVTKESLAIIDQQDKNKTLSCSSCQKNKAE